MRGDKAFRKKLDTHCIFCHESDANVLDVHRINEGCNGGTYDLFNTVRLCSNCHRKIHRYKSIEIKGWVSSTKGQLLHCVIDGKDEFFEK